MHGRRALRIGIFAAEVAFIVGIAYLCYAEDLGWWTWLPVIGAWALTVATERLVAMLTGAAPPPRWSAPRETRLEAEPEHHVRVVTRTVTAPVEPAPAPPVEPAPTPVAAEPPPAPAPVAVAAEPPPPPEPEPAEEPEPEPELVPAPPPPAPVVLTAVPQPPPEPEPVPVPVAAERSAAQPDVVQLTPRGPREWNIWDLERLTREHAGSDSVRDEERSYLLVYLRDFASADGMLPLDFDGLVRESFGDLVGSA